MNPWLAVLDMGETVEPDPATVPRTQFCVACDCEQNALDGTPCWQCGATPTPVRPEHWCRLGSSQTFRANDAESTSPF